MSGMKFRLQCSGCNATFFSTDRRARHCPKCVSKRAGKSAPAGNRPADESRQAAERPSPKPVRRAEPAPKPSKAPTGRPPKVKVLTPELREQIVKVYEQEQAAGQPALPEVVNRISDQLWVTRAAVNSAINKHLNPDVPVTPEMKAQAIEMYAGYVARGERPPGGRRNTIAKALGIPFRQVRDIVYQWSLSEYAKSPTDDLSREQRFEIEKLYLTEIDQRRYHLDEITDKIAAQLSYTTPYQIARWLDTMHEDAAKLANVPDVPSEVERQILDFYQQYLDSPAPPEQGLHATIAEKLGTVSKRQVHKVLLHYRHRLRAEYPLK